MYGGRGGGCMREEESLSLAYDKGVLGASVQKLRDGQG